MKAVCLWSGGKDSCFACYKAGQQGYRIISLLNFMNENGFSLSHGLSGRLIFNQGKMLDIPLVQKAMPKRTYREEFKNLVSQWKQEKEIEGIIFGDIYLPEHKDWIDRVCKELEVKAIMPLWGLDTKKLIREFIDSGFETIVVTTDAKVLGPEELGSKIDRNFIERLKPEIDPCGEKGEFHTFVYDGPGFKRAVEFKTGRKVLRDNHWFLELKPVYPPEANGR